MQTSTTWIIVAVLVILLIVGWFFIKSGRRKAHIRKYEATVTHMPPISEQMPKIDYASLRPAPADPLPAPADPPPAPAAKITPASYSYPIEDTGLVGDKRPLPPPPMPSIEELMPYLKAIKERPEPVTEHQLKAVQAIGFFGDATQLTNGQASAILSSRSYMKGVMHDLSGGQSEDYPNEELIDANIVKFIIKDADLRKRVIKWNERSYSRGYSGSSGQGIPMPKKDGFYYQVAEEIKRVLRKHRV